MTTFVSAVLKLIHMLVCCCLYTVDVDIIIDQVLFSARKAKGDAMISIWIDLVGTLSRVVFGSNR